MKVKSYFVANVGTALALARQELGPDAVLLETRKAPPEAAHLGEYEVVFGTPAVNGNARGPDHNQQGAKDSELDRLRRELGQLRAQLERMNAILARGNVAANLWKPPAGDSGVAALGKLLEKEVAPELATQAVDAARLRLASGEAGCWDEAIAAELKTRCMADSRVGKKQDGARVVALVGPSGAGKTTMLVKLAVREGLERRQSLELLSLDNYRIGGAEQLRHFATILGVAFQALERPQELAQALEESSRKDLVLIDTPGFGPGEEEEAEELAEALCGQSELECHLVLTAAMRSADLWRVAERFERFRPGKLAFTRLDETETYGPLWSLAVRLGKPVSFMSRGQRIPEDLVPATAEALLELVWDSGAARSVAAGP